MNKEQHYSQQSVLKQQQQHRSKHNALHRSASHRINSSSSIQAKFISTQF